MHFFFGFNFFGAELSWIVRILRQFAFYLRHEFATLDPGEDLLLLRPVLEDVAAQNADVRYRLAAGVHLIFFALVYLA